MRDVFARGSYLFALLISTTLVGCTKASSPEISLFSQALPSLTWTWSQSPLNQEMQTQGHVRFVGECSATVTGIQIQLNDEAWRTIPSTAVTPVGREGTAPAGVTWNADCTNGKFDFWIFQSTAKSFFPALFANGDDGDEVSVLRLRATVLGVPAGVLEFHKTNGGGNGNGTGDSMTVADHVAIRSWNSPLDAIGPDTCASFDASLVDSNGNQKTSNSDVSFTVQVAVGGNTSVPTQISTDQAACDDGNGNLQPGASVTFATAPVLSSTATIRGSQGYVRFYYKPTWNGDAAASMSTALPIKLYATSSLSGAAGSVEMTIRPKNVKHLSFDIKHSLVQGACYPFRVSLKNFGGADATVSDATPLTFGAPAGLQLFENADCSGAGMSGPSIAANANSSAVYSMRADSAINQVRLEVRRAANADGSPPAENIEPGSQNIFITTVANAGPGVRVAIEGPENMPASGGSFILRWVTNDNTAVPWPSGKNVTLTAADAWGGLHGNFCLAAPCNGANASSVTPTAGSLGYVVSYTPSSGAAMSFTAKIDSDVSTTATTSFKIYGVPERLVFTSGGFPTPLVSNNPNTPVSFATTIASSSCVPLTVTSYGFDAAGNYGPMIASVKTPLTFTVVGGSDNIYSDGGCVTSMIDPGATTSLSIPAGSSSVLFSFRPKNFMAVPDYVRVLEIRPPVFAFYPSAKVAFVVDPEPLVSILADGVAGEPLIFGTDQKLYPSFIVKGAGIGRLEFSSATAGTYGSATGPLNANKLIMPGAEVASESFAVQDPRQSGGVFGQTFTFQAYAPTMTADFIGSATTLATMVNVASASVSRATIGTYYDVSGTLVTAAVGDPRIEFDPITHVRRGLLIEEGSTNLIRNSDYMDMTVWSKTASASRGTTIPMQNPAALSTYLSSLDAFDASAVFSTSISGTLSGADYTFSAFVKPDSSLLVSNFYIQDAAAACLGGIRINFSTNQIFTSCGAPTSWGIQLLPNGWMRISLSVKTGANDASSLSLNMQPYYSSAAFANWAIPDPYIYDGVSGVLLGKLIVWGLQFEARPRATSYIQTSSGTTASRAADILELPTGGWSTSVAPYAGQISGTFKLDYEKFETNEAGYQMAFVDSSDAFLLRCWSPTSTVVKCDDAMSTFATMADPVHASANRSDVFAFRADRMTMATATAQSSIGVATGPSLSTASKLKVAIPGYIKSFRYWNRSLSSAGVYSMAVETDP